LKILVVGGGGREHALAWRLAQSRRVQNIFVAPGNGGMAREPDLISFPTDKIDSLAAFAQREQIALTVVGPEAPLAAGIVDLFRSKGLKIFGPTQAAAQLESSKDFAKAFMKRHGIPTADYQTFTDLEAARAHVNAKGAPIVIKADGLAAGKGVVVAMTLDEAHRALDDMLGGKTLGKAGARVVIEEFLEGEEASFIVMVDGRNILPLASSQDHKRLLDGDKGPNTGGMGAYSPAPVVSPAVHAKVLREIIRPTVEGMAAEGIPYTGFLYAGLMIDAKGGVKTVEFNCRLGDPEAQPIMARLKSDFVTALEMAIDGNLDKVELEWDRRCALGVVLASANYPGKPRIGDVIDGLHERATVVGADVMVFHSGTKLVDDKVVTTGGRVLCVTGLGDSVKMAQDVAYEAINKIKFAGMQFRRDIGNRALPTRLRAKGKAT
jgi:phosphoribosylamine---glycine ligase